MSEPRIRNRALCIFHHEGKILCNEFEDPVKAGATHPVVVAAMRHADVLEILLYAGGVLLAGQHEAGTR